ncbi:unnamed protein product, partial [marine sediment metagenome]
SSVINTDGHTYLDNVFNIDTLGFIYHNADDSIISNYEVDILNTPGHPSHDALIASNNVIISINTNAPFISITLGPTNDILTNKPFTITLNVDSDFGYWSTNSIIFIKFPKGNSIINITTNTVLKYYG